MTRLYVFDADGTLRRTRVPGQPCPRSPEEWELLPDVVARLAAIPFEDGIELGIASNQDQVAYGHLSAAMARALLAELADQASGGRARRPWIELCTDALEVECACRKPAPGMLLRILARSGVDRADALFVGDAASDREAASRAGVRFAWAQDFFGRR
jgi:D-glycero-D-manno-heptose 1,7-bisphosphate phosphatase